MGKNIGTRGARWPLCVGLLLMVGAVAAHAEQKKDSGPTQAQIDCKNQAVNDYYDEVKGCEQALSDDPGQLKQCKDDAYDEMRRDQAACMAAMAGGAAVSPQAVGGGVIGTGNTRPPRLRAPVVQPGGILHKN